VQDSKAQADRFVAGEKRLPAAGDRLLEECFD
jgi:hypothetical protein